MYPFHLASGYFMHYGEIFVPFLFLWYWLLHIPAKPISFLENAPKEMRILKTLRNLETFIISRWHSHDGRFRRKTERTIGKGSWSKQVLNIIFRIMEHIVVSRRGVQVSYTSEISKWIHFLGSTRSNLHGYSYCSKPSIFSPCSIDEK